MRELEITEEMVLNTPVAEEAIVFFCPNPDCNSPHIVLFDEDGDTLAHYIISDEFFAEVARHMKIKKNQ